MSKMIKMTPDCIEECKKEFTEALSSGKFPDGKVTFTKTLGTLDRKAIVYFTEIAWLKMQTLIKEFTSEVGWHGVASRGEEPDTYMITDILVYPQEVTGVTVTPDQEKYQNWLMSHDDDIFNNIRMQGHSHVNMSTYPSSVDTAFYDSILEMLDDSMFYIFMIWNKRAEKTIKVYDLAENVLFETTDVTVKILDDDLGVEKFLRTAKELVVSKTAATNYAAGYGAYGGNLGYGGYGYGCYNGYNNTSASNTAVGSNGQEKVTDFTKQNKKESKSLRKGKRRNKEYGQLSFKTEKSGGGVDVGYDVDDDDDDISMAEYYRRKYCHD